MERLPLICLAGIIVLTGCMSGDAAVTKDEEELFKNGKVQADKEIPPDAMKPKGPAFIGEPSGATNPSGQKPPVPGV